MSNTHRIDVHQHVVPALYAEALASHGGDPSGSATPSWSLESAIAFMDSQQITTGILSVTPRCVSQNSQGSSIPRRSAAMPSWPACAASTSTRRSHRVPPCPLSWHSPAPATSCSAPTSPTTTASPQRSQPRSTRPTASRPTTRPRSAMATPGHCSRALLHTTDRRPLHGWRIRGSDGLPGTHMDSRERTASIPSHHAVFLPHGVLRIQVSTACARMTMADRLGGQPGEVSEKHRSDLLRV
jgi:hypothetical protein